MKGETNLNWLDETDSGFTEDNVGQSKNQFPWAQIHNDKAGSGKNGGLFLRKDVVAPDTIVDEKQFKVTTLTFEDGNDEVEELGWISQAYHLGLLAFDHTTNGMPKCWKDERGKWCLTILCTIKEAFSEGIPFKITYKGTSAIRIANLIRSFDQLVIGKATALKQKANSKATSVCRHQMWLPVTHTKEKVGYEPNTSWACPVQDIDKATEKVSRKPDGKVQRTGVSVLKAYSDDLSKLRSLFVGLDEAGKARMMLMTDWVGAYAKDAVKIFDQEGNVVGGVQPSPFGQNAPSGRADFATSDNDRITEKQINYVEQLAIGAGLDTNEEIQVLRGANQMFGGEDTSVVSDLSRAGASKLIEHLNTFPKTTKREYKASSSSTKNASAASMLGEINDDDSPF